MALPRKRSRPFTHGGRHYRYVVSEGGPGVDGWFTLRVTLQCDSGGAKLVATTTSRDPWLDFPERYPPDAYVRLGPAVVRKMVDQALGEGWDPDRSGPTFVTTMPEP